VVPRLRRRRGGNALGLTAAAQEAGIPITHTYISDAHDDHYNRNRGNTFAPGQPGYEAQLKEYNAALTAFFERLSNEGSRRRTRCSCSPSTRAITTPARRRATRAVTDDHAVPLWLEHRRGDDQPQRARPGQHR
jgi:hypothetical protein